MGKGEIPRYKQFLLFPQRFQKACFPGASEGVNVWEWDKRPLSQSFNPFPKKPWFLRVCSTSFLKTPCEKKKLLLRAISSFLTVFSTHLDGLSAIFVKFEIVVCLLFRFGRVQNLSFGKGLKLELVW